MLLLGVTVLAVAMILLGSFIGKMMLYVACLFAIYVVGLVAVSGLCRLATKAIPSAEPLQIKLRFSVF